MNLVKKAAGYLGQIGETFDKVNSFIDLVSKLFHSSGDINDKLKIQTLP